MCPEKMDELSGADCVTCTTAIDSYVEQSIMEWIAEWYCMCKNKHTPSILVW